MQSLSSISVDFSKTIGGPTGSGAVIFNAGLEEYATIHAPYLSDDSDQTLSGSRRGIDVVAMYSLLSVNSAFDIKEDILNALGKTDYLAKAISSINFIKLLYNPELNYVVFSLTDVTKEKKDKICRILQSYSISSSMVKIGVEEKELFKIIVRKDHSYRNIKKLVASLKKYE